ncbi:25S rRNA (adenine645-N1)-methyltransferase [Massospora cicadina]|nr:25S rRNA (adenine645-N1)-methyltransferase [Massospora cicadina]
MSKPLFSTDGWCMPTSIAKEITAKSSIGKAGLKREAALNNEVLQLANVPLKNSSEASTQTSAENAAPVPSEFKTDCGFQKGRQSPLYLTLATPQESLKLTGDRPRDQSHPSKKAKAPASDNNLTPLQKKLNKKLQGAKFRIINEMLYTMPGDQAFKKFQAEPDMFEEYHTGFRSQVESWPTNPIEAFIKYFRATAKPNLVIADMGCGEAELALKVPASIKVHSFDLVATNPRITACDIRIRRFPTLPWMPSCSPSGGELKIAEVVSRSEDLDTFVDYVNGLGFLLTHRDETNKMFVMLDFIKDGKVGNAPKKAKKKAKAGGANGSAVEAPVLKPCIYKRR